MYLVSLQGHATSAWPGSSGAPIECSAGTHSESAASRRSYTSAPMRVMMCIDVTT